MGWPVPELQVEMPFGMLVTEDSDSVLIHCHWCGEDIRYARGGPAAEKLVSDARTHRDRCTARAVAVKKWGRLDD